MSIGLSLVMVEWGKKEKLGEEDEVIKKIIHQIRKMKLKYRGG